MRRKAIDWTANYVSDKRLISRVYKELIQVNIKKWTNKPEKNGQRTWVHIFPKKTWQSGPQTKHKYSSGKCKSKPKWDITSYQSESLPSKGQQLTSIFEGVEKKEHSHTVDGISMVGYSHYENQYDVFSKKLKLGLPYDPTILFLGMYLEINEST